MTARKILLSLALLSPLAVAHAQAASISETHGEVSIELAVPGEVSEVERLQGDYLETYVVHLHRCIDSDAGAKPECIEVLLPVSQARSDAI